VGVTGSRSEISAAQKERLYALLERHALVLHHGDCLGADATAHAMAQQLLIDVVVHPPTNPKARAWCMSLDILPPKPYLERNHDIVDASRLLLAFPATYKQQVRSGTWATIRYGLKVGCPTIVVLPNGKDLNQ